MADLCASILVVLGAAWVVRRAMDGADPRPLTAARRRLWVFLSLLAAVAVNGLLAGTGLLAWRGTAVPAALLVVWLVLCRMMVRPRNPVAGAGRPAGRGRWSPAALALTGAAILALWIAVNPLGEHPDQAASAAAAAHTTRTADEGGTTAVPPLIGSSVSPRATEPPAATQAPAAATAERTAARKNTGLQNTARSASRVAAGTRRATGSGIVMATRGAIVYVGNNGRLTANTGATSSSGAVALGVRGSGLRAGDSGDVSSASQARRPGARASTARTPTRAQATSARAAGIASRVSGQTMGHANRTLADLARRGSGAARGTSLSGFEDHSVSVAGDDQIVTYDDSNVFIDRKGTVNANTGDTDSSGLNAVDVGGSTVRAGNSGDGEGSGEDDGEEEEAPPTAPAAGTGAATGQESSEEETSPGGQVAAREGAPAGAPAEAGGDPDDAEESGDEGAGVTPGRGQAFGTVTDEGASAATGKNAFVVGADGVDDVSIRSQGRNDIVTYDDSNVTIGGEGKVNAQIGDSDTGGGVVMGIRGSDVRAGCEGDLCYSANPAVTMATQLLASGVHLTPAQRRQLVDLLTSEYTSGQSVRQPATTTRR